MAGRPDLHRLGGDVHVRQFLELMVHRRQPPFDHLGRHPRRDVQEDPAVRGAAARLDLGVDGAGDLVAGEQLGRPAVVVGVVVPAVALGLRLRVLLLEDVRDVVEHEAPALAVAQHPAVTPDGLGDEDPLDRRRPDHPRRMELHELHVDQRGPGQQRQGVPVARVLPRIRRHLEGLADPAGGQHHGRRLQDEEAAGLALVAEGARDLAGPRGGAARRRFQDAGDRALLENLQPGVVRAEFLLVGLLQRDDLLLEGTDQLQPRTVADVRQPRVFMAAEVALGDPAVGRTVEERAPGLQLPDPVGGLPGVEFGHPPVVEELAAAHGVAEVHLPVVALVDIAHAGRDTALGHHRMGLAEQGLADHGRAHTRLAGLDRGAQSGPAGAHHDHVPCLPVHVRHQTPHLSLRI